MGPFEFIITLLSFVYSLALAQLLFGVARWSATAAASSCRWRTAYGWSTPPSC